MRGFEAYEVVTNSGPAGHERSANAASKVALADASSEIFRLDVMPGECKQPCTRETHMGCVCIIVRVYATTRRFLRHGYRDWMRF